MPTFPRPDLNEFFRTYAITTFAVSKDETKIAFSTNLSGKYNIWGLDLQSNTYPYQLTYIDQPPSYIKFDPSGHFLVVGFDQDGDENVQMYTMSADGGALKPIRTFDGRRHYLAALSKDGQRVYYSSDKENHNFMNSYVYNLDTGEEKVILKGEGGSTDLVDVAPDESSFVYVKAFANTYVPAFVQRGEEVRCLTPNPDVPHVVSGVEYYGDSIIFTTNYDADRTYLARFDVETGEFTKLLNIDGADLGGLAVHDASKTAFFVAHEGVEDTLYAYDIENGSLREISGPFAVVEGMRVGESGTLYVLGRSDVAPFNIFARKPDGEWSKVTNNRVMGIREEELVKAQVVKYPSFDGLQIEALWFEAHPETANGYTVVWPHGGPQASERRMFRPLFQFLCSRGYNVWAPNFRGSAGYGAEFMKMVEGDWGHGPRLDMVESIEWLTREGKADRDKLFCVGGSYGGYMTLLLHSRHADLFKAFVDIFGPSNLFTFLESVPDHWKPMMKQWLGDPVEDKERLTVDSPITYLEQMTKPMFVVQGANDPRVVKAESDQIVAALRHRGVDVEYLVFDDEGHGFMKKANEIEAYGRVVEFLDKRRQ